MKPLAGVQTWWVALAALSLAAAAHAGPFHNTVNKPFATRCNGPQGAILVPEDGVRTAAAGAFSAAVREQYGARVLAHPAATLRWLKRHHLAKPNATLRLPRVAVHTRGGQLVLPDLERVMAARRGRLGSERVSARAVGDLGDPGNQLAFTYEGWSAADQASLSGYLATAYPKARFIYGPPALNTTVKIIRDTTVTDIQGGIYDATTNEIHMAPLSGNFPEDSFVLLLLVLHAFHGNVGFYYDAWEQGFAGAAATAIQTQPGISPGYDPANPGTLYALSVYEAENHPNLANPVFASSGGDYTGMLSFRISMARAAWLKCWIEDNSFFSNFNQLYYSSFVSGLPGDVPSLRDIAATVLPTVEGLPFDDWFVRQYVLDTSARAGLKEYTWNIPLADSVGLLVEYYLTDDSGNEFARSGTALTNYWSYDFSVSLATEEGNSITIPSSAETPGEGQLAPSFFNIGGPQRITVQVDLGGLRSYYPYAYSERGFAAGENNLYGGILNETDGTVNVTGGNGISGLTVSRGAWGGRITVADLSPLKLTARFTNSGGQDISRQFNVGWDSYCIFLDGGGQTTLTYTFSGAGDGLHLMSLPLTPLNGSAPAVLGILPKDLLLARWDPSAPPDGMYRVWPSCEPFALGRAFWLRCLSDVAVSVTGVAANDSDRITVPLELGWNMFGPVRQNPMAVTDLKVQVGTDAPMALADAVTAELVQNGIFSYGGSSGYDLATQLQPFEGYWIRALTTTGCQLVFDPVTTAATKRAVTGRVVSPRPVTTRQLSPQLPAPAWKLPLVVQAGKLRSAATYLGGAKDARGGADPRYDLQAPPAFGQYVAARFIPPATTSGAVYLTDVRGLAPAGQTWEVEVSTSVAGAPVQLTWPDLSQLPRDLRPILVDLTTGRRQYMRTTPGCSFPGSPTGVRRRVRIEMAGPGVGALSVSALAARTTTGGMTVAYTLSRDATVTARVLNLAGRPVRTLQTARAQAAGTTVLPWNLRDDRGLAVPDGVYRLEVQAQTEDGQAVRSVGTAVVHR